MAQTTHVRWGLLRPGTTVAGDRPGTDRKIVSVEHRGRTVSVLFWDGTREQHPEDSVTSVRLRAPSPSDDEGERSLRPVLPGRYFRTT